MFRFLLLIIVPLVLCGQGRKVFESRCAMCHGDDANGGEFAPGILTRLPVRNDAELTTIISEGLPKRGMPAVPLPEAEMKNLVAYLRTLKAPRRGEFSPTPITVELTNGGRLSGVALNQSFEDLQMRSADGKVHLLRREGGKFREVTSQSDWASYDGAPVGHRFSTLTQINAANVSKLRMRWIFSLPDVPPLEGTPLVYQGIMYVTSGNECYALDAGTGRQVWRYQRERTKGLGLKVNRGAAVSGDKLFMQTDDARLIALNRHTGELLWETPMADPKENYFATSAPIVAGGLVVAGIGGGDSGVRGFLSAFDPATGKEAWRFWTIPQKGEKGAETWTDKSLAHPGGATWFTGSYDAESGVVYWQVGNPGPDHNGDEREGDNLYSDSVIALDAKTGKLKWYFQFTPHDVWDWDAQEPLALVDSTWQGKPRKLLVQANRNGFFYVFDRSTGELLLGKPFVNKLTWAKGLDAKGRPIRNDGQEPSAKGTKVCPAVLGATNWWSTAFDPASSIYYVETIESCGVYSKRSTDWQSGSGYMGGSSRNSPADGPKHILKAIDIRTGNAVWEMPQIGTGETRSGNLATASGLVFLGEDSGALMAADSKTGKPLWAFQTSQSLRASPMTYMFDNRQYVAIESGSNILAFALPDGTE